MAEVRSKARRLQLEQGLDLIMIDYIQLMTASGRFGSRQEEVSAISRSLKGLATELGVPVIALSQLSRAPTGRANHRPMLSDIRESGAIEQDADVVMFIHREDYYEPETAEKNIAEIIIAKQRNGALGTVKLGWKGEYTWFMDLSPRAREAAASAQGVKRPREGSLRGGNGVIRRARRRRSRRTGPVRAPRTRRRAWPRTPGSRAARARVRRAVAHGTFHHRHPKHPLRKEFAGADGPENLPGACSVSMLREGGVLCAGNFCRSALQADDEGLPALVDGEQHRGPFAGD